MQVAVLIPQWSKLLNFAENFSLLVFKKTTIIVCVFFQKRLLKIFVLKTLIDDLHTFSRPTQPETAVVSIVAIRAGAAKLGHSHGQF